MDDDPAFAQQAWAAGAAGYVLKEASRADLVRAIRMVSKGGRYLRSGDRRVGNARGRGQRGAERARDRGAAPSGAWPHQHGDRQADVHQPDARSTKAPHQPAAQNRCERPSGARSLRATARGDPPMSGWVGPRPRSLDRRTEAGRHSPSASIPVSASAHKLRANPPRGDPQATPRSTPPRTGHRRASPQLAFEAAESRVLESLRISPAERPSHTRRLWCWRSPRRCSRSSSPPAW